MRSILLACIAVVFLLATTACASTPQADADASLPSCGGLAGRACAADAWCAFPEGTRCGAADRTGECRPRPTACSKELAPVCGCDGRTYPNRCFANRAGTDVERTGPCEG